MTRVVGFIVAVALTIGATSIAQEKAKTDLTGVYGCEGKNPDGSPYKGIVQIAAVGDTYLVRWTLPNDVEVMGVGILRHDTLSVSYFGGTPAIVVYNKDGDRLVGEWTMGGTEGEVFAETLTRMESVPREPADRPAAPRPSGVRL
jgi:hypothetical protein